MPLMGVDFNVSKTKSGALPLVNKFLFQKYQR